MINNKLSLHKENRRSTGGFTIIEILIVILLIGVLLTVLALTYSGIRQREHNNTRISDIKLIQAHLETYYAVAGYYPTLANINNPAWVQKNLVGIDKSSLIDPTSKSNVPMFSATPVKGEYTYAPTAVDGSTACNDKSVPCGSYVLSATLEGGAGTFSEKSLN